jgi:hypothetical protein
MDDSPRKGIFIRIRSLTGLTVSCTEWEMADTSFLTENDSCGGEINLRDTVSLRLCRSKSYRSCDTAALRRLLGFSV